MMHSIWAHPFDAARNSTYSVNLIFRIDAPMLIHRRTASVRTTLATTSSESHIYPRNGCGFVFLFSSYCTPSVYMWECAVRARMRLIGCFSLYAIHSRRSTNIFQLKIVNITICWFCCSPVPFWLKILIAKLLTKLNSSHFERHITFEVARFDRSCSIVRAHCAHSMCI